MESLTSLLVFTRVAEERSFSGAADRLGISKATVSKEISRLEDRLGVRLLQRTTRYVALTDVGQALFERSTRIVEDAEEAERAIARWQAAPRGLLRVSAPVSFAQRWLSPMIGTFLEKYPDLELELSCSDRFVDLLEEGFDVAIRIARLPDSSLIARKIAPSRRRVVASPDYLQRRGVPRHPSELASHECLLYTYQATGEDWRFQGPDGEVMVRVRGRFRVNNGDVLAEAARAGRGLALIPDFIVEKELANGSLVGVLDDYVDHSASIYAVVPGGRHIPTKARVFMDFLTESCQTQRR